MPSCCNSVSMIARGVVQPVSVRQRWFAARRILNAESMPQSRVLRKALAAPHSSIWLRNRMPTKRMQFAGHECGRRPPV